MRIPKSSLKIGQVFYEDEDFITLKIGKTEDVTFDLSEDDEFFTILFVHMDDGEVSIWDPMRDR